ncbi:phosphatidylcholine translocator ABCB4 [Grus japonensis]|uniref:Phosphatidylcholine translocator ABCB4 n=1 Tax=Grus japonensis TaxID=30415 RepID=A0ABC9WHK8_GRUJA
MALGQSASFTPDYAKAKMSAAYLFMPPEGVSSIDSYSEEGEKPISKISLCITETVKLVIVDTNVQIRYSGRRGGVRVETIRGIDLLIVSEIDLSVTSIVPNVSTTDSKMAEKLLDGQNAKTLNIRWLRAQIGIVSQEPILFDCPIAADIACGDSSREVSREDAVSAAKEANIHSFIESLPKIAQEVLAKAREGHTCIMKAHCLFKMLTRLPWSRMAKS